MKNFKKSKTYKNLEKSFAGESMAHLRYSLYEKVAREEGHKKAAEFFAEAKDEEKGHATLWFKLMNGGALPKTKENIKNQIEAENEEWTDNENSYETYAKIAREEGYEEIAKHFEEVASEEEGHEDHLHTLVKSITK
jgi:rubrerythrin